MRSYIEHETPLLAAEIQRWIDRGDFDTEAYINHEVKKVVESIIGPVSWSEDVTCSLRIAEQELRRKQRNG